MVLSEAPTPRDLFTGVPELALLERTHGSTYRDSLELQLLDDLRRGHVLLLLDGLDEVAEERLPGMRSIVSLLETEARRTKLVVTCRSYDYFAPAPNRRLPIEDVVRLCSYRVDDMLSYVRSWYAAVVKAGRLTERLATELCDQLLGSLEDRRELAELGETPLLLVLLTLVHTEEGELPSSRALVYHRAIRYLLAETAQWRRQAGTSTIASAEMMMLAQQVAYLCHAQHGLQDEFRGLSRSELRTAVAHFFELDEAPSEREYAARVEKVDAHVSRLIQSNGLLVDQGGHSYAFAHKQFQEFLAGQYFAPGGFHAQALEAARDPHWHEAFRLLAGFGAREGGSSLHYLVHLIDDLSTPDRDGAEAPDVILAAEMLREIGRRHLSASGYDNALRPDEGLWSRIARQLCILVEATPSILSTAERVRAATVLGGLGDVRLFDARQQVRPLRTRLVELEGGSFLMGSDAAHGKVDERPRRLIAVAPFAMGRFLVTNAEYRDFVSAGGYANERWWAGEVAKGWVKGDADTVDAMSTLWADTVETYHGKELRDGAIDHTRLPEEARKRCGTRSQPFYWGKRASLDHNNQPVVGINWWEAQAYCAWLTASGQADGWLSGDCVVALPSEREWEYAARGEGQEREYPWGDDWDDDLAHLWTGALRLRATTPVGCYPDGQSRNGILDLVGNAWEWLEDLKLPYDATWDSQRLSRDSLEDRAIRGSSWYNTRAYARCAARFVDRPYNFYPDLGFRVVVRTAVAV